MSVNNSSESDYMRRLRWQCRRGIKEVEVLLVPFFEQKFAQLTAQDQALFEQLLQQHDVDMFEWFTRRTLPEDAALASIVQQVMALGQPRSE